MVTWKNLDTLASYQELENVDRVNLAEVMSGENGAERVRNYSIPMKMDSPSKKPKSIVCDFSLIEETIKSASNGIQPKLLIKN